MPDCVECGAYTKYKNGVCSSCYGKKKGGGNVYVLESTRRDGTKQLYTGITRKDPGVRFRQHEKSIGGNKTWIGRGTAVRFIGSRWSGNPEEAEKTVKKYTAEQKLSFAENSRKTKKRNEF